MIKVECTACGEDCSRAYATWRGCPYHIGCIPGSIVPNRGEAPTITCHRCGQTMPADAEPDGCRDPDCPEAK